jgi:hypothetical protein
MALNIPVTRDLRYTLTASGSRVYARMGAQELRPAPPPARRRHAQGLG